MDRAQEDSGKGIRTIFFDAGGTLIHLDAARIAELLGERFGIAAALEKFPQAQSLAMRCVGQMVAEGAGSTERLKREFYGVLLPEIGVPASQLHQAIDEVLRLAESEMLWRMVRPETATLLGELRALGYQLAVVSNSDGRIEKAFVEAGLHRHFDFFIDSFLVGVEKPDPRIFHLALDRAGVAAEAAAYVGDLYAVDIVGARRAGLLPVLYDPQHLHADADCLRIHALSDLLAVIRSNAGLQPPSADSRGFA